MATKAEKLEALAKKQAQIQKQIQALKARDTAQERKDDTRRKVLLGALVLHRLENSNDPDFTKRLGDWLRRELPDFLTCDGDKELFADLLGKAPHAPSAGSNEGAAS